MSNHRCYVCGNTLNNREYNFADYHFRTPGLHSYFQCSACDCLQFDFSVDYDGVSLYPSNYYSFKLDNNKTFISKLKWTIRNVRNAYYQTGKGIVGSFIHKVLPCMSIAALYKINVQKNWKILDVGCGNDALMLQHLAQNNYQNLTGIDPFISTEVQDLGGVTVFKKNIYQIDGTFDLITFNHSFEHLPDERDVLMRCKELLSNDGSVLIRIPVVSSYAWEHYKEYWLNLDAPRHVFLHSVKSILMLIEQCGFKSQSLFFDSTSSQFWGSELYKLGLPLSGKTSLYQKAVRALLRCFYSFTKYKTVARLNDSSQGDCCALLIKKAK
jgi:SAM-dependent methyltransferase